MAIGIDSDKLLLTPAEAKPEVALRSKQEGVPIKDTRELILRGEGYDSENDARTAGELYCPAMKGK